MEDDYGWKYHVLELWYKVASRPWISIPGLIGVGIVIGFAVGRP